jgi:hypothetical protein
MLISIASPHFGQKQRYKPNTNTLQWMECLRSLAYRNPCSPAAPCSAMAVRNWGCLTRWTTSPRTPALTPLWRTRQCHVALAPPSPPPPPKHRVSLGPFTPHSPSWEGAEVEKGVLNTHGSAARCGRRMRVRVQNGGRGGRAEGRGPIATEGPNGGGGRWEAAEGTRGGHKRF